ncbi:MAG: gliding motility-associated C-terminal domain-containing protein [Cyclobacteriaceae bacterium]
MSGLNYRCVNPSKIIALSLLLSFVSIQTIKADTPSVTTVEVPTAGTYKSGDQLFFRVNWSKAVFVTGTPLLNLTFNSGAVTAAYLSGSGSNALLFRYTVQTNDNDPDGILVNSISGDGTIQDSDSDPANRTLNGIADPSGILVDAVKPTVQSVGVPSDNTYLAGQDLDFTVNWSENVTVTGSPTLGITIGSQTIQAAFDVATNNTSALRFSHTVATGELDTDGVSVGSITIGSATIKDGAGNTATVTLNSVGNTDDVRVDAVAPTVSSVNVPSGGTYASGEVLEFTVNWSENVSVTGNPSLNIELTSGNVAAVYDAGSSTASTSVFRYTVQADDLDLNGVAVVDLTLGSATIQDAAGNNADLTLNNVSNTGNVDVDAVGPKTVTVDVPVEDTYTLGEILGFRINWDEEVTVTGNPVLKIVVGAATVDAAFISGSGTTALTFRYTISDGDQDSDGIEVVNLDITDATIQDDSGNDADITLNKVDETTGVLVDASVPTITSVSVPTNDTYGLDEILDFTLNMSEAVTVNGSPGLRITVGLGNVVANFIEGSGSDKLKFRYTVFQNDKDTDGIELGAIELLSAVISDGANDADLTLNNVPALTGVLVDALNDPPTFAKGPDIEILEDSEAQTFTNWATEISPGTAEEASQVLTFVVTNNNEALFNSQPSIDTNGTLTFDAKPDASGLASVSVVLRDDVGASSTLVTFSITVTQVNDRPSFQVGEDLEVEVNSGTTRILDWATGMNPGPGIEEFQFFNFEITTDNDDFFSVAPAVSSSGQISFTLVDSVTGVVNAAITMVDVGGTENGGIDRSETQNFIITVIKIPQTITIAPIGDKRVGQNDFDISVTGGESGNPVEVTLQTDPSSEVAILQDGRITIVGSGTVTVVANQAGNAAFQDAETAMETFQITLGQLFLPTLFTPNGDGRNEVFILRGVGADIETIDFRIIDRNGTEVYKTTDADDLAVNGWDGTQNGKELPTGAYIWVVEGQLRGGQRILVNGRNTGVIRLLR